MPQKIDIHGLFIDPATITDLSLQKRISVFFPVFYEIPHQKSLFSHQVAVQQHILQFDHQEPYGIILQDNEQPDSAGFIVTHKEAIADKLFKAMGRAGKNVTGHAADMLKIDLSGDREYRILQSGRTVKKISIREIPAKVRLLNGQWVDVFKSSRGYDFQGGNPYAVTDVGANALTITTVEKSFILYGAGVDVSNEEVLSAYQLLITVVNEIQLRKDAALAEQPKKQSIHEPKIPLRLPKAELPKFSLPQIKIQSPFVIEKKQDKTKTETQPESVSDSVFSEEK